MQDIQDLRLAKGRTWQQGVLIKLPTSIFAYEHSILSVERMENILKMNSQINRNHDKNK